jgi:hypothetical protein
VGAHRTLIFGIGTILLATPREDRDPLLANRQYGTSRTFVSLMLALNRLLPILPSSSQRIWALEESLLAVGSKMVIARDVCEIRW